MKAVITGDIINSRSHPTELWLEALQETLNTVGQEPKAWEIYRGDSFQIMLDPDQSILKALQIKATIKQFENLDVRLGVGIGEIDYQSDKITSSNGSAFFRSGESFEALKKQNFLITSGNKHFDDSINTMLSLAMFAANRWTPTVSKVVKLALERPGLKQQELASLLQKSQSNISEALKRGAFDEILAMNAYFVSEIKTI